MELPVEERSVLYSLVIHIRESKDSQDDFSAVIFDIINPHDIPMVVSLTEDPKSSHYIVGLNWYGTYNKYQRKFIKGLMNRITIHYPSGLEGLKGREIIRLNKL